MNTTVTIIQRILTHYRIPFFNRLKKLLDKAGIDLQLIYGQGSQDEELRKDQVDINWAIKIHNYYLPGRIVYQPCYNLLKDADLVIVEQANRNLLNYGLLAKRLLTNQKVAFWGHGRNYQVKEDSFANRFKWLYSDKVDWWFAYTEGVKREVAANGFPLKKITAVQNSIDTFELIQARKSIIEDELMALSDRLELGVGPVGVFCGGMYREKKIPFLLEACFKIRDYIHNFQMLFIGGGTEAHYIQDASKSESWIHYLGPLFGREKVKHILLGDICLNPGVIGLVILDMLALQLPMITTHCNILSPETEYLEHGRNGIITPESMELYVREVVNLLNDRQRLGYLKQGCSESAKKYTIENMALNFTAGIRECLGK